MKRRWFWLRLRGRLVRGTRGGWGGVGRLRVASTGQGRSRRCSCSQSLGVVDEVVGDLDDEVAGDHVGDLWLKSGFDELGASSDADVNDVGDEVGVVHPCHVLFGR